MTSLQLYTTAGCHLCEQAAEMLAVLQSAQAIAIETVEIANDAGLVEAYGIRIPVVRNPATGRELGWPFDLEELATLV